MIGVTLWVVKMLATMAKVLHKLGFIDAGEIIEGLINDLQNPTTTETDESTTLGD